MADLLTSFGVDWRLLGIQAVNFAVLVGALTYLLYKPVTKVLDERREKIAQGVKDADAAHKRLEGAQGEAQEIVGQATRDAEGIVATAKERAEQKAKDIVETATERSAHLEEAAKLKAQEAARQIMDKSNEEIARTAILAAERLLRKKLT